MSACVTVETDPDIPALTTIPPTTMPAGPPMVMIAMPAPVVKAEVPPARATLSVLDSY